MEKPQKTRIIVTLLTVLSLVIGFTMSILLPTVNGIDLGLYSFLGWLVFSVIGTVQSFRKMNKRDRKRDLDNISNTKYYGVIITVMIVLSIMVMILTYFDMDSNYQLQKNYNAPNSDIISVLIIPLLLAGILIYDKYFKKNRRRGKGEVRRGWNENEKQDVRDRQGGVCNKCGDHPPRWEYHHKNGHSSDNRLSNCEALCPNCHSVKTHG